jgi:hypothetical protein
MKKGRAAIAKKAERLETLKVEYVPINSLKPNGYNPNKQSDYDFELLCRSIIEDGYTQPIIIQEQTDTIVDGEHRWTAMIVVCSLALEFDLAKVARGEETINPREFRDRRLVRLDWLAKVPDEEVGVVKVAMTEEQMKIATLRHNRARGDEDIELTAQVLRDLQELGALDWAQESLQMSDEEINRMIEDVDVPEALAGDDFGESWEPSSASTVETNASSEGQKDKAIEGTVTSAMSQQAVQQQQERSRRLEEAKNEEEKEMIRQENKLHRVSLVFTGDEAELIEESLGKYPAEMLVKLCKHVVGCGGWAKSLDEDEAKG